MLVDLDGHDSALNLCLGVPQCKQNTDQNGNTTVVVTQESDPVTVKNDDGSTSITWTTTVSTYVFSEAGNLLPESSSSTVTHTQGLSADNKQTPETHSDPVTKSLNYRDAVGQFGANNLLTFTNSFAPSSGFMNTLARDYKENPHFYHSVVTGGAAIPIVEVCPPAGAALAAIAIIEAIRDHMGQKGPL
jgi:hypothetical protein